MSSVRDPHAKTCRRTAGPEPVVVAPAVRRIPRDAVFLLNELQAVLALPKSCLKREVRLGRLRVAKRSGRYFVLGAWVREWIEGGEVRPRQRPADSLNGTTDEAAAT